MVFTYCDNCGHSEHENRCSFQHWLGNCNCNNYNEKSISSINELNDEIQSINSQDTKLRQDHLDDKKPNMEEWFRIHLKLRALEDRWFRHYGIMNYSTPEPI